MSITKKPKTTEGVVARHARSCASRAAKACDCRPAFQAWSWDPVTHRKLRRTFPTVSAAKSWRAAAATAISRGELRAGPVPTVQAAAEALIAGLHDGSIRARGGSPFKPSTIVGYEAALRRRIIPALGRRRLSEVSRGDLTTLAERMLGEGRDGSSVRNMVMPLRLIFRRALDAGTVTVNPTAGLALPTPRGRRDRIATPAEAAALLAAVPEGDSALWGTALLAGLRLGEIAALDWSDVDFERGVIVVERAWCPKAHGFVAPKSRAGHREVPIIGPLRALLLAHRLRTGRRVGLVFGGRSGELPFSASALRVRALAAWAAAAVPVLTCDVDAERREGRPLPSHGYLTLHEGRHTYCSTLLAAGVNPAAVSRYAGHASVGFTLARYTHALSGTEAADVARVEELLAAAEGV